MEKSTVIFLLICLIQLILISLKLFKVLSLSWLWVLSPAIFSAVCFVGFVIFMEILLLD